MIEGGKDGKAKTVALPSISHKAIRKEVLTTVIPGSTLITDEYGAYHKMNRYYDHQVNNHSKGIYITKDGYSSNNIEGFWRLLKDMIRGAYKKISPKHLQKYLDELTFRFNTRNMSDAERFCLMLSKSNCRLTYKQLIGK